LRTKQEIVEKVRQIISAAREDFIARRTEKSYRNCKNNDFVLARRIGKIFYCKTKSVFLENGEINKLFTCDSDEWSCKCEEFECKNESENCVEDFDKIVSSPSQCGKEFPRLSALLWVLNDGRSKGRDLTSDTIHGHEKNKESNEENGGVVRSVFNSIRDSWRKT